MADDNGHSVHMSSDHFESGWYTSITDMVCVLKATGIPTYVIDQIDSTRAVGGMQRATWGNFKASWTYHPDHGLNLVLTDQ